MQETLALLKTRAERFGEAVKALAPLDLCGDVGVVRERRRDGEPETHEQRERLGRDAGSSFELLDPAREPIQSTCEGRLPHSGAVRAPLTAAPPLRRSSEFVERRSVRHLTSA